MDSKILEIGGGGLDVTGLDRRSKFISEQLEFWISSERIMAAPAFFITSVIFSSLLHRPKTIVNMHQIALIALQHILCYWIVS